MEKPDWALWVNVPSVTLEECVCLSLDSEPEIEQRVPFVGGIHIFRYWDTGFTGTLNTEQGKKRLETLRKHFDARSRLLPPFGWPDYYGDYSEKRVRLGDFADWAYTQGWEVPARIDVTPKPAIAEPVPLAMAEPQTAPSHTTTPPAPPVVIEGASGGVKPDKAEPLPLTTGNIAFCFAGLRWDEQQWKKPLGDKRKWLAACIAIPGARGVSETRWNPVLIGAALEREGHAKQNSIRARFQTMPQLAPWRDAWKTYEADNFDTK